MDPVHFASQEKEDPVKAQTMREIPLSNQASATSIPTFPSVASNEATIVPPPLFLRCLSHHPVWDD